MGAFLDFVMGSNWADRNSQQQFATTAYDLLKGGADPSSPDFMNGIVKSGWQPRTVDDINGLISLKSMKKKELAVDFDLFKKMVTGGEGLSDEVLPAYAKATNLPEPVFNTLNRQKLKGDIAKAPLEKQQLEGKVADIPMEQRKLAAQTEIEEKNAKGRLNPAIFVDSVVRDLKVQGLNPSDPRQKDLLDQAALLAKTNLIENKPVEHKVTSVGNTLRDYMWDAMVQVGIADPETDKEWGPSKPVYNVTPEIMGGAGKVAPQGSVEQTAPPTTESQSATGQQDERAKINQWGEQRAIAIMKANPKMTFEKALTQARDEFLSGAR
jgi:hypothetical protein